MALRHVQRAPEGHGLEAWRLVAGEYQKDGRLSSLGEVDDLTHFNFGSTPAEFISRLVDFQLQAAEHDRKHVLEELPEDIKKAIIIRHCPEPLKTHLKFSASTQTYNQLCADVERFFKTERSWGSTTGSALGPAPGLAPPAPASASTVIPPPSSSLATEVDAVTIRA